MIENDKDKEIMQFFDCEHLPPYLRGIADSCVSLAYRIIAELVPSEERSVALRKLLEAKDAAVRASLIHKKVTTKGI